MYSFSVFTTKPTNTESDIAMHVGWYQCLLDWHWTNWPPFAKICLQEQFIFSTVSNEIGLRTTRVSETGNGFISPDVRHVRKCCLKSLCLYVTITGSWPTHRRVANASDSRPQYEAPCWCWTFIDWNIKDIVVALVIDATCFITATFGRKWKPSYKHTTPVLQSLL